MGRPAPSGARSFFERNWLPDMLSGLGGVTDDYASLTDHLDGMDPHGVPPTDAAQRRPVDRRSALRPQRRSALCVRLLASKALYHLRLCSRREPPLLTGTAVVWTQVPRAAEHPPPAARPRATSGREHRCGPRLCAAIEHSTEYLCARTGRDTLCCGLGGLSVVRQPGRLSQLTASDRGQGKTFLLNSLSATRLRVHH